ncbi:acetyl-CoA carboxylase, biotin carboxyl carrier protein [Faecalibacillus faecis]|uniref:acetyl-CoA carboxylase biotin carboxyl carrier protein n=1 Tax=Faecalibacillus faecis TaxID=1982628 RepID=UPI001D0726E7|nr:biotin/lipoyl-containing protein [Faecalibacillus faecis]MCB7489745.1 acetyl-CoA carboxylase, biotin carboxyl carrier protein [Faecalibacillus faecis]MCG4593585.1 acetyl-CoA carboxylase, biotin carboxyl carrier protein [Faecalibacillus faecis]
MKLDFIKQIMSEFDQSNVTKMKVEINDLKIELEKESEKVEYVKPVEKEKEVIEDKQIKQEQATGTAVKSPIVGVFYSASSPESEPYVTVGKNVKKGDIVCIIEAMKVMNEIKAPCDGTVTSILVENEALVEYDQALMVIE